MGKKTRWDDAWRSFTDWKGEFRKKEKMLGEYYEEIEPLEMVKEIFPPETLSTFHLREDDVGNTGLPCGIIKYTESVDEKGKAKIKKRLLFDNYGCFEKTQNNRLAMINMCTYFGMQGRKNALPSKCHGFAIDLDGVREKELVALLGMIDEKIIPTPTYIVNSGHGLHLYYVFEIPVSLKQTSTIITLNKIKKELINLVWNDKTSADNLRQYTTIFQDMRIPGSWTKFGMKNKSKCSYIIRAYKVGEKVDLTYLTEEIREYFPTLSHDWASESYCSLTLEEAKKLYPKWYQHVVIEGHKQEGYYTQTEGLYKWWYNIITQNTEREVETSREGNRWNCLAVLFVMAFKAGVPMDQVTLDANDLIPFMNSKEHSPDNELTLDEVLAASNFYDKKYVRWSNQTIAERTSIKLPPPTTRRNGRSQEEHLKRARAVRVFSTYENNGRPSSQVIVEEWQRSNPSKKKSECIKETGLSKPTVYRWWK